MSNETVYSNLPGVVNEIKGKAYKYATAEGVMKALVTPLTGTGYRFDEPYYDVTGTSATAVAEGTSVSTKTQLTTTRRTYSASAFYVYTFVTDFASHTASESTRNMEAEAHGYGQARNLEVKLLSTFASAGNTITATSAAGLTWQKLQAAKTLLDRQIKFAPGDLNLVISPDQNYWFMQDLAKVGANYGPVATLSDTVFSKYAIGRLMGNVDHFTSNHFTASATGYQSGGLFSKAAIGLFMPSDLGKIDLTYEYNNRDRGYHGVSAMWFGAKIRVAGYACKIAARSVTPS